MPGFLAPNSDFTNSQVLKLEHTFSDHPAPAHDVQVPVHKLNFLIPDLVNNFGSGITVRAVGSDYHTLACCVVAACVCWALSGPVACLIS